MRIVCDELDAECNDHEEYVDLMKEQLDTRHRELDAAYEDIELLRGALDKRKTVLDHGGIEITLDGHFSHSRQNSVKQVGFADDDGEESLLPTKDSTLSFPGASNLLPRRKSRQSFIEVVGVVSKKLEMLREVKKNSERPEVFAELTTRVTQHFRGDTMHDAVWFDEEKDVIDWEVEDVMHWLEETEGGALERYIEQFEDQGITGEAVLSFTHYDLLQGFNMDRGHIKIFFKSLAEKSEIVKMRLRDQKNRREKKKRKRVRQQDVLVSSIIRSDAYDRHIQKLYEKEFGKKKKTVPMNKLYPGDVVDVGSGRKGRIFWKGNIAEKEGEFIGVELHAGIGKNDGSFDKKRYFRTLPNRGIFTKSAYEVIKLSKMESVSGGLAIHPAEPQMKTLLQDVEVSSSAGFSGSLHDLHQRSNTRSSVSESGDGDESFDFSWSDSSDDEASETVTFGHNRHFSEIPTISVGKLLFSGDLF